MSANYEAILNTITAEQWEAIAAFAAEKAKKISVPEITATAEDEVSLTKRVTELLRKFGVPAHIKGYGYLRRSVILAYKDHDYVEAITKLLYPEVAQEFKTTSSRVERSIRHAIEVAWDRGDIETFTKYFNWDPKKGKPTNSEFIAAMADYLHNG